MRPSFSVLDKAALRLSPRRGTFGRIGGGFRSLPFALATVALATAGIGTRLLLLPLIRFLNAHSKSFVKFPYDSSHRVSFLFLAILFAPVFETLLCQLLPFAVARKFGILARYPWCVVIVSGLFFGLQHIYSVGYMLWTAVCGVVLALGFLYSRSFVRGFWVVAFAHVLMNLYASLPA